MRQQRRTPSGSYLDVLVHRASQRHRGARTDDSGIISRPAGNASHNLHNHTTDVIVRAQCAELTTPMCGARPTMCGARRPGIAALNAGNSEFPKFGISATIVILRIFCFGWTLLSCPLLSCSVVTLVSDRCPNQCGRKADRMRTKSGHEPHWRAQNAVRTETRSFAAPSTPCRAPLARVGVRTRLDICPNQSGQNADEKRTDVRFDADKMRTESGHGLASGACRLRGRRRVSGRPAHRVDGRRGSPRTILPQFSPTRSVDVGLSR
jgi:hypothetical protein